MAHISSIGAGLRTRLDYKAGTALPTAVDNTDFLAVPNIREFPEFGAPANVVNVPVYGQAVSSQIQGQSDAPTLEFTLNYVPTEHDALRALISTQATQIFRIRLINADLADEAVPTATEEHTDFYVLGKVAAITVSPQLTDANQATLTITTVGDYSAPLTTTT